MHHRNVNKILVTSGGGTIGHCYEVQWKQQRQDTMRTWTKRDRLYRAMLGTKRHVVLLGVDTPQGLSKTRQRIGAEGKPCSMIRNGRIRSTPFLRSPWPGCVSNGNANGTKRTSYGLLPSLDEIMESPANWRRALKDKRTGKNST